MLNALKQFDTTLFYAINGAHNGFFDKIFYTLSQHWFIGASLVLVFLAMTLRKEARTWLLILAGIGLCFLLADRISVVCFKDVFCRLRPCHALGNVHLINGHCGGQYGFISSHAANVFSLAVFLTFVYKKSKTFVAVILAWAFLIGYSRIYLGVHYPGDVFCGALLGFGIGSLVYFLYSKTYKLVFKKKTENQNPS